MQLNLAANGLYMPDYEAEKGKLAYLFIHPLIR